MTSFTSFTLSLRSAFGVLLAAVVLVTFATPAYADPHAMFYTAVGQQQLFFNVLAALDQADYVEPAVDRQRTLDKRAAAGFKANTDPVLTATKTDLASLLTRSVTLEGNDLWSSYVAFQFALESVRRKNSTELLTLYCKKFLARGCEESSNESPEQKDKKVETANVTKPLDQSGDIINAGHDALFSGTDADQQKRRGIATSEDPDQNKFVPYNPAIAELRDSAGNNAEKKATVSRWITAALESAAAPVDATILDDLNIDNEGKVSLREDASINEYADKISALVSMPNQLLQAKTSGQQQKAVVDEYKIVDGVRADTIAKAQVVNGRIGTISEEIVIPAYLKEELGKDSVALISRGEGNPYYVDTQENIPGGTKLSERSDNANSANPNVAGARTTAGSTGQVQTGSVLGDSDSNGDDPDEDVLEPRTVEPAIPRDSNPTSFTRESSIGRFLNLLGGRYRGGSQASLDDLLRSNGPDILNSINR